MSSNVTDTEALGTGVDPNHPAAAHLSILDGEAGLIEKKRDKLAIVGFATSSRDLAPFDSMEHEIIGLNQLYRHIPRADIWADLHCNAFDPATNVVGTDHRGWVRDCGIPVLMTEQDAELPTSVRFPIERCIELGTDYFTSSIALLVAWAIERRYTTIELYGIDLCVGTEYEVQKSCAEHWLGVASGMGINVVIPGSSALLWHSHRYGYELEPDYGPLQMSEITHRKDYLTDQLQRHIAQVHNLDGSIQEMVRVEKAVADGETPKATERLADLRKMRSESMALAATIQGAIQEIEYWHQLFTLRGRGAAVASPHSARPST